MQRALFSNFLLLETQSLLLKLPLLVSATNARATLFLLLDSDKSFVLLQTLETFKLS